LFSANEETGSITHILSIVQEYGLQMTLDIDHLHKTEPHNEQWFEKALPKIGNIHISSFSDKRMHSPIYMGDFRAKEFLRRLIDLGYVGLLTMEIYYPSLLRLFRYDFETIKRSVEFIRVNMRRGKHPSGEIG
jgi:sugar phosphate isomerase/epimerase